jgi:hypothetical protein
MGPIPENMRSFLFILVCLICTQPTKAQILDYITYKQECNSIYLTVIDSTDYKMGLRALEQLQKKHKVLCGEEFILKAFCYHKLGNNRKASIAMRDAWAARITDQGYLTQINGFTWHDIAVPFNKRQKERIQEGYRLNGAQMSKDYDSLLFLVEKLNFSDQEFRTNLDPNDTINMRARMMEHDSLDIVEFIRIYDTYGFPGEKVANLFSMTYLAFFLHSADYDWFYDRMKERFLKEVQAGNMGSSLYLNWLDRHAVSSGKKAVFAMYGNPNKFQGTPEEIHAIQEARLNFGVVYSFRVPYDLR